MAAEKDVGDVEGNSELTNEFSICNLYEYPGGRAKSKAWEFFGFKKIQDGPPTRDNLDMSTAYCRVCMKAFANKGNTTNFQSHIQNVHGGVLPKKKPVASQPKLDSFITGKMQRIGPESKQRLDDSLNKLIIGKSLPVSIVDNIYFQSFVLNLDPRYKLPTRYAEVQRLQTKKDEMAIKLQTEISEASDCGITHDGWTSMNTESYFTTTIHYIDRNWNLQSAVLGTIKMPESHTSENIANELKATQSRWSFPDPIATTDNAANEQKAFEILGWTRFGCYGHRINLMVKHALSLPECSEILGKARKLVSFFHKS